MSIRKRLDKLDGTNTPEGRMRQALTQHYAAMTNEQLLAEVAREVRAIRAGGARGVDGSGTRNPFLAHLSDEELLADVAAGQKRIAERDARDSHMNAKELER